MANMSTTEDDLRHAICACLEVGWTKEEINEMFDEELELAEAPRKPHVGGGPKPKRPSHEADRGG